MINGVRILFVLEVAAVVAVFVSSRPLTHSDGHCTGPSTVRSPAQRFLFAYVRFGSIISKSQNCLLMSMPWIVCLL